MRASSKQILALSVCVASCLLGFGTTPSAANEDLQKMSADPSQWVIPLGNYGSQRYSELKQINLKTAAKLHPVWTFSTGVLRGHEGGPLVIGDMMYLSTPFPNTVFALDLKQGGRIAWKYEPHQDANVIPVMCCDTVNRGVAYGEGKIFLHQADTTLVALDAQDRQGGVVGEERRSRQGRHRNFRAAGRQGQGPDRHLRRRVRRTMSRITAYDIEVGQARPGVAFSSGPDDQLLVDPVKTHRPCWASRSARIPASLKTWQGDQWKNRRRLHMGLAVL